MNIQSVTSLQCKKPQFGAYKRLNTKETDKSAKASVFEVRKESEKIQNKINKQNELIGNALYDLASLTYLASNNASPQLKDLFYKAIQSADKLRASNKETASAFAIEI